MAVGFILVIILAIAAQATYAVEHEVGGSAGWELGVDYAKWAAGEIFHIGDTLRFNYNHAFHSVNQVTQESYTTCTTDNSITAYSGGSTTIKLQEVGPMFFICPVPGHCASGMKLSIVVSASTTTPTTPTLPGTTTPTTPNPPCDTTTPATLTPPYTATPPPPTLDMIYTGGSGFVEANYLINGVSMVLVMVVGFMSL